MIMENIENSDYNFVEDFEIGNKTIELLVDELLKAKQDEGIEDNKDIEVFKKIVNENAKVKRLVKELNRHLFEQSANPTYNGFDVKLQEVLLYGDKRKNISITLPKNRKLALLFHENGFLYLQDISSNITLEFINNYNDNVQATTNFFGHCYEMALPRTPLLFKENKTCTNNDDSVINEITKDCLFRHCVDSFLDLTFHFNSFFVTFYIEDEIEPLNLKNQTLDEIELAINSYSDVYTSVPMTRSFLITPN